jgi:hypothetical protein
MPFSKLPGFVFRKAVFNYLDAGGEQTVVELQSTKNKILHDVFLDLSNMTQNGTVRVYYKIDGTNYREFYNANHLVAGTPGMRLDLNFAVLDYLQITYQEAVDEGDDRMIPYSLSFERRY